jgi:hypothetical protein
MPWADRGSRLRSCRAHRAERRLLRPTGIVLPPGIPARCPAGDVRLRASIRGSRSALAIIVAPLGALESLGSDMSPHVAAL